MKAVIFDMDGVLIDSEPLWRAAERQVFAEAGLDLTDADCELTMGMRTDEVIAYWFARSPWQGVSPDEVERRLIERMQILISTRGQPMSGLEHALDVVRNADLALALASSSSPILIETVLHTLGLTTTFEVVRSAIHESHGKPHPAVFLATARDLGFPPSRVRRHRRLGGRGSGGASGRDAGRGRPTTPPLRGPGVRPGGRQAALAGGTHPTNVGLTQCGRDPTSPEATP